jgi:Zn-dependent peptidase ImmA (M78 family)
VRKRFTVAHEIGHFIYHQDRLAQGTSDTLAYRIDGAIRPNPMIGPTQEWQANNFAANLLIPNHYLKMAQAQGITDDVELAKLFNVSRAAMRIKLGLPPRDPSLPFPIAS